MAPSLDARFALHGLPVSVSADDADLAAFVRAHFDLEEGQDPAPDINARLAWYWGESAPAPSLPPAARTERAGRGLLVAREDGPSGAVHALWTRVPDFPELTLHLALSGETSPRLGVEAVCAYVPRGLGRKLEYLRPARVERKRGRLFFKLMYFGIYYPLAWSLRRGRGWGLVHASAIAMPGGKGALLAGMGGSGKSTLALSLLSRPGARLVSDNLLFHDDRRVYGCPEPVRLDSAALSGIAASGVEPDRTDLPLSAHPKPTYAVGPGQRADSAPPASVFFLSVAARPEIEPIDPARAAAMLSAGNDLAREIEDYRPFAALLESLASARGRPPAAPAASLERLLQDTRCAIFRRGEKETVADTSARLIEAMEAA